MPALPYSGTTSGTSAPAAVPSGQAYQGQKDISVLFPVPAPAAVTLGPVGLSYLRKLPIPMAFLRDRVNFEVPKVGSDGQGGTVPGWDTLATNVPTFIQDVSIKFEAMSLGALGEHVTHRLWIRQVISGLNDRCRVYDGSKHYNVRGVDRFGGNTLIQCEEIR